MFTACTEECRLQRFGGQLLETAAWSALGARIGDALSGLS
jgi:hypothetical protein